jgi:hypothetical protein
LKNERGHRVAIVQSNYIPWKGYFDLIDAVDEFVLIDDLQFTRRDWRNRNAIKTPEGSCWLTIPVEAKGRYLQTIRETRIADVNWRRRHLTSIRHHYARAEAFKLYVDAIQELYDGCGSCFLSEVNRHLLEGLCRLLGITTRISSSDEYRLADGRTTRLVEICKQAGASTYLSGPSARSYLDHAEFTVEGIEVRYMDYSGYPEYPQLFPPFEHHVSVLDLILNVGAEAPRYMKIRGARTVARDAGVAPA